MDTMSQRVRPRSRWVLRGFLASLFVLGALLVPAGTRGEPPNNPGKAVAPDGPLFQLVRPENVAVLGLGAAFAPADGPWGLQLALRAGAQPQIGVWEFAHGPLTRLQDRRLLGAQTLFLGGFSPAPGLPTGLAQLGVLQAGEDVRCWELIDTDQCRPFPPAFLEPGFIVDGKDIANGTPEAVAYAEVLTMANYTSQKAFHDAACEDLTYSQIFAEPARYRGKVVRIEGRLRRLARLDPPLTTAGAGVNDLYEAWLFNDVYGEHPFCVLFTALPPSLKPYLGEAGAKKIREQKLHLAVSFDGYFFKKFRYKAIDSKANTARDAPAFIGHSVVCTPGAPGTEAEADEWGHSLMAVFIGIVGFAVVVVVALTWWFRRSDQRVRGRVMAAREQGFVPPPPDEVLPTTPAAEPPAASETGPEAKFGGRLGDFSGPAR